MNRLFVWLTALSLALFPTLSSAQMPPLPGFPAGVLILAGAAPSGPTYQGPGDVVSGAIFFGSCARAYSSAITAGTSMCDLTDSASTNTVICTLQTGANGRVNLAGTYCTGGLAPAAKCAAATGGTCQIAKVYDQTGHSNDLTNSGSNKPTLSFAALNSLPSITCSNAVGTILTSAALTQAQPLTISHVYERTANPTNNALIWGANVLTAGTQNAANGALMAFSTAITATAADNAFHALQGVANGASSALVIDGSATTGNAGTNGYSATAIRFCRNATSLDGSVMEVGMWPSAFNSTQYGNMNSNQHSATVGYNF